MSSGIIKRTAVSVADLQAGPIDFKCVQLFVDVLSSWIGQVAVSRKNPQVF